MSALNQKWWRRWREKREGHWITKEDKHIYIRDKKEEDRDDVWALVKKQIMREVEYTEDWERSNLSKKKAPSKKKSK